MRKVYQSKTTSCRKGYVALVKTLEPFLKGSGISESTVSVMYTDSMRLRADPPRVTKPVALCQFQQYFCKVLPQCESTFVFVFITFHQFSSLFLFKTTYITCLAVFEYNPACSYWQSLGKLDINVSMAVFPAQEMRNVNFVFVLQEGYWELTTELGEFINVNVDLFANVFLKSKGIRSLGENCQNLFQAFRVEIYFRSFGTNSNIFLAL